MIDRRYAHLQPGPDLRRGQTELPGGRFQSCRQTRPEACSYVGRDKGINEVRFLESFLVGVWIGFTSSGNIWEWFSMGEERYGNGLDV